MALKILAAAFLRPGMRARLEYADKVDKSIAVTLISKPPEAIKLVDNVPGAMVVENTDENIPALAVITLGDADRAQKQHKLGLLDLLARALRAEVVLTTSKDKT